MVEIQKWLRWAYNAYLRKKHWRRFVRAMAVVVVFCTTYALILPAITLETKTVCGYTEHIHSAQCYELQEPEACTLPETQGHTHTEDCWQETESLICQMEEVPAGHIHGETCQESVVICGMEETPGHIHDSSCTVQETVAVCEQDHAHTTTCYYYKPLTVCGLEENPGHSHGDSCRETRLICTQEEVPGHAHAEACYLIDRELICGLEESAGHSHSEDSTEPVEVLICQLEEHRHTEACDPVAETEPEEETLEERDPTADLETAEEWEAGLASVKLTGNWTKDFLSIARSQLGYSESRRNYIYDENNVIRHYSRYGQWIGQPYGDWSASFVSFCLHYGEVQGIVAEQSSQAMLTAVQDDQLWLNIDTYAPQSGDLIFLDRDGDGVCDHVGIVEIQLTEGTARAAALTIPMPEPAALPAETTPETEAQEETASGTEAQTETTAETQAEAEEVLYTVEDGLLQVIAGGVKGRVDRVTIALADTAVLGFARLPEDPEIPMGQPYIHEKEDGRLTQVMLQADSEVPDSAELTVTEITATDETYVEMTRQVEALLGTAPQSITLLDISFYDADGEYLNVTDPAQVVMDLDIGDADPENIRVFHFVEGAPVELTNVSVTQTAVATMALLDEEETEPQTQTQLMFETEGFSVFAVVEVVGQYELFDLTDVETLDGNSFYIISNTMSYGMKAELNKYKKGLAKIAVTVPGNLGTSSLWTFTKLDDGTFLIHSGDLYLSMPEASSEGWASLQVTTKENATAFTVSICDNGSGIGQVVISYTLDSTTYYVNLYQGNDGPGFYGWRDSPYDGGDSGSKNYLYRNADVPDTSISVLGLDGKSYAIVNSRGIEIAMSAVADLEDGTSKSALDALPVSIIQIDGSNYYSSMEDVPLWTFTAVKDKPGVYYISTTVGEETKYLNMTTAATGDLTLSATPQELTVSQGDNGKVLIGNGHTYLNSSGSDGEGDFWCWNGTGEHNQHYLCTKASPNALVYYLNRPTESWYDRISWDVSNPVIAETGGTSMGIQMILADTEEKTLYSLSGRNFLGKFISFNTNLRTDVSDYFDRCNQKLKDAGTLTEDNYLPPGAEWVFLGWKATIDGIDYLFPEGAAISEDADGNLLIEDTTGTVQTVPLGTTLVGQWEQVSNVVMFFVNFGDTMLENEDNKLVYRTDAGYYTQIVAIGHLYNPEEIVTTTIVNNEVKRVIVRNNHTLIENQLAPAYDPSNTATQLVVDAIGYDEENNTFQYIPVSNYNELQLEEATTAYIRNQTDEGRQILLNNAVLDQSTITKENYKLYWFAQILVPTEYNPYHINGVLVAKTQPMKINKTFSGLTRDEAVSAIGTMEFPLHLIRTSNDVTYKDYYTKLVADGNQEGVYTNDGWQSEDSNIYKWTLESVQGQRYAFEETGYEVADHDVSSLISVHYTDGRVIWKYNTDATYEDVDTATGQITDYYAETEEDSNITPLIGGQVESVIFANFYTATGTGAFSVSKVADAEGKTRLQGAEFTLYGSDGTTVVQTASTNENGSAHFADLAPGTYILSETEAPDGYQGIAKQWQVVVETKTTTDADGNEVAYVTVTVDGEKVYDGNAGGILKVYQIENTPESTTVTVNKYFSNISDTEIKSLKDAGNPYQIAVTDLNGNPVQMDTNGDNVVDTDIVLTLSNGTAITGAMNGYTWTINLPIHPEGSSDGDNLSYRFTEKNFLHDNYLDTAVAVTVNTDTAVAVTRTDSNGDDVDDLASFVMEKGDGADTVNITNTYTNTFRLKITKVDATNNGAPMSGVMFNVYGDFNQGTSSDKPPLPYTDANGDPQLAYYIGTTSATGTDGITWYNDMKLSTGSRSFIYVIEEVDTPAGYIALDEPIVRVVEIDDEHYSNGVYALEVENHKKDLASVTVTVDKVWNLPEGMELGDREITLHLYRQTGDDPAELVHSVTLDGSKTDPLTTITTTKTKIDSNGNTIEEEITATLNGWQVVWTGLSYAQTADPYVYYVREEAVDGFSTSYSTQVAPTLTVEGGTQVCAAVAEGRQLSRATTVTNTTGYALPDTGGSGTRWQAPLGLMLIFASVGLYWLGNSKKKKQGGVMQY